MAQYPNNKYPNPYIVSEPHFMPGYGGHCPGFRDSVGRSFARQTYLLCKGDPVVAKPLSPCRKHFHGANVHCDTEQNWQEDVAVVAERQSELYKEPMIPKYAGYIPRSRFIPGENYRSTCVKSIAEMERIRQKVEDHFAVPYEQDD